ncbi:MAG: DUF3035 domain-containing protein [Cognatishimia sp.]
MVLLVSACANERGIRVLSSDDNGPDEFAIIPTKPLAAPENYTTLPAPTPGGRNVTDPQPLNDVAAALGGRKSTAVSGQPYPIADDSLVSYAARRGAGAEVREQLAQDDEIIRGRFDRFTGWRLSNPDRYNEVYRRYHLNAYRELSIWRARGVKTPAAPSAP